MKRLYCLVICTMLLLLTSCDVHEWPDNPSRETVRLVLKYDTQMTQWQQLFDGSKVTEQYLGPQYDSRLTKGKMRYIVRTYPVTPTTRLTTRSEYNHEFVFTQSLSEGYDREVSLYLEPGEYTIMVWADIVKNDDDIPFYDAQNFGEISLQGEHTACTDYRDAFRGSTNITLTTNVVEHEPQSYVVEMSRPLAKFEFITDDLQEFIAKEMHRIGNQPAESGSVNGDVPAKSIRLEDYNVVFQYVGFMPNSYSIFTDKPVDSSTGVIFRSGMKQLNDREASIGFDYLFVNGKASTATVRIGIYDKMGTELSMSNPIELPVKRNRHTIVRGKFLMLESSQGIYINPDYEGDNNIIFTKPHN